jgi:hypothetical protein
MNGQHTEGFTSAFSPAPQRRGGWADFAFIITCSGLGGWGPTGPNCRPAMVPVRRGLGRRPVGLWSRGPGSAQHLRASLPPRRPCSRLGRSGPQVGSGHDDEEMIRVTWDSGVFYNYEERAGLSQELREALEGMVALHDAGQIELRLVSSTGSELQSLDRSVQDHSDEDEDRYLENFSEFEQRVLDAGLSVEFMGAIGAFDIDFRFNVSTFADDVDEALQREIFRIQTDGGDFDAPPASSDPEKAKKARRRWRADRLDAAIYETHLRTGGELMVTNNWKDFIGERETNNRKSPRKTDKREALLVLDGDGRAIFEPIDAFSWLQAELATAGGSPAAGPE